MYHTDDLICALATPWAEGALGVLRTSGPDCVKTLSQLFSRPRALQESPGERILYGHLKNLQGEILDEVTLGVYRAPRSYTGEEAVEIFCHGSLAGIREILAALHSVGFRQAGPGEFTLRAFLHRKMDLTQAEAVAEVVRAKTSKAQSLALHRLGGVLHEKIEGFKRRLLDVMALVNIQLDYAEDDVEDQWPETQPLRSLAQDLKKLAGSYRTGQIYQEGVKVVLAGKTNAGKSSLFNLLLREDRSIVSQEHGTTRDYLESWVSLKGIPLRLFDTAGLRDAENLVEQEGIRRSKTLIEAAGALVYLVDGSLGATPEDEEFLKAWEGDPRLVKVWNKVELTPAQPGWLGLSARTGEGLETLEKALEGVILGDRPLVTGEPVIDSLRQKDLLEKAAAALESGAFAIEQGLSLDMAALDLREALDSLGEITGEVTTADILNHMFGSFCVGK